MQRSWLVVLMLTHLMCGCGKPSVGSSDSSIDTISLQLAAQLQRTAPNTRVPILVSLRDRFTAQSRAPYQKTRLALQERHARRINDRRRGGLPQLLQALQQTGDVADVVAFWIVDAYEMSATPAGINAISNHPAVETVTTPVVGELLADSAAAQAKEFMGPEDIGAPQAWLAGYDGAGIRVGVVDNGLWHEHPALDGKLAVLASGPNKGLAAFSHNGNIVPPSVPDKDEPHGTHVAGIVVGGQAVAGSDSIDSAQTIGVAPAATLLFGSNTAVIQSLQWLADPDGDPMTDDHPLVINNSWINNDTTTLPTVIDNLHALGITVVFSAGNSGTSGPGSIRNIHTYPPLLLVGNAMQGAVINPGSSKGPALWHNESFVKPDVAAPGTKVLSSVYPGGYADNKPDIGSTTAIYKAISGTSMSAPMVTGAAALIQQAYMQAHGEPLSPSKLRSIMQLSSQPTPGATAKDHEMGAGLVSIPAAIALALNHQTVFGKVSVDGSGAVPFATLTVVVNGFAHSIVTEKDGTYELALPPGSYTIEAAKAYHGSQQAWVQAKAEAVQVDFQLGSPGPVLSFAPGSLIYHAAVGGSQTQEVELFNQGDKTLIVQGLSGTEDLFQSNKQWPLTIPPYGAVVMHLTFTPGSVGELSLLLEPTTNATDKVQVPVTAFGQDKHFVDVATEKNLHKKTGYDGTSVGMWTASSWADLNGDGRLDLIQAGKLPVAQEHDTFLAYQAQDGAFLPAPDLGELGAYLEPGLVQQRILTADMDNDGDQDVVASLLGSWDYALHVFGNNGSGTFTLKTIVPSESDCNPHSFTVADFNNDGRLDIAMVCKNPTLSLDVLLQTEQATFAAETWHILAPDAGQLGVLVAFDYDNDGFADIVRVDTHGYNKPVPVQVFRNEGGAQFGLVQTLTSASMYVDIAICDLNNDGQLDVYAQRREPSDGEEQALDYVFVNQASQNAAMPFAKTASPFVPPDMTHIGAATINCVDTNSDGWRDLFFGYDKKGFNRLFQYDPALQSYTNVADLEGIEGSSDKYGSSHTSTWADIDNDGDLDAYVTTKHWYNQLYRNDHAGHSLTVALRGTVSNREGIGARVVVTTNQGLLADQLLASHHSVGQSDRRLHFGLGTAVAEEVTVYWPGGLVTHTPVDCSDRLLTITEGTYGDATGDGKVNVADVQCVNLAVLAAMTGGSAPSCLAAQAWADLDCNGDLSVVDSQLATKALLACAQQGCKLPIAIDSNSNGRHDSCEASVAFEPWALCPGVDPTTDWFSNIRAMKS